MWYLHTIVGKYGNETFYLVSDRRDINAAAFYYLCKRDITSDDEHFDFTTNTANKTIAEGTEAEMIALKKLLEAGDADQT